MRSFARALLWGTLILTDAWAGELPCLNVRVENVVAGRGSVRASLYGSASGFPDRPEQALQRQVVKADAPTVVVFFPNTPPGVYAVSVYQDLNDNGRLDKNFWGIPREPFGASNNPPLRRGPPRFAESRFIFGPGSPESAAIRLPLLTDSQKKNLSIHD